MLSGFMNTYSQKDHQTMQPVFDKLDVPPAYRVVAEAVERNILVGRLKIGDKLPSEFELAKQFGVHRSTVREGIRLLEQSGLVSRVGRTTLEVTLPPFQEIGSRASRALSMHQVTFRELWEASMLTEPAAAEMACARMSDDDIATLERNCDAMAAATEDLDRFVGLDTEFHDLIAQATGNKVLKLMREPISVLFLPAGQNILPRLKTHHRLVEAHRHIIDALKRRDATVAREWMARHMADFKRAYERTGLDLDAPLQKPDTPPA